MVSNEYNATYIITLFNLIVIFFFHTIFSTITRNLYCHIVVFLIKLFAVT